MTSSSSFILFAFYLFITALIISTATASVSDNMDLNWLVSKPICHGSIAECMAEEDGEFDMDTEINRRILATNKYISYQALQRNSVPCSRRGASYYNCRSGAQANPYNRGCNAITRCRS